MPVMMKLFEWMDWCEVAEALGMRLSRYGRSYSLRRESDGEIMKENLSADDAKELLNQLRGKKGRAI